MNSPFLIAGADNPVLGDYATHTCARAGRRVVLLSPLEVCRSVGAGVECHPIEGFSKTGLMAAHGTDAPWNVVVFLGPRESQRQRDLLDLVADLATVGQTGRVCLVSSFRVHFGDRHARAIEDYALNRLRHLRAKTALFRPGFVQSHSSWTGRLLRAFACLAPLVPRRFRSCCVNGEELFAELEREADTPPRGFRTYTLLGPNRPWRDRLQEIQSGGIVHRAITAAATVASWLLLGSLLGVLFGLLVRVVPRLRPLNFDTLWPESNRELLALYNPYNTRHVKVVGYNNGVVHFGQRHPDKTVVSTVRCNQFARVRGGVARFDAGVTVHQAAAVLARVGKEFHVVPNYSYVSLGTSFFVPIHGSAGDYSTMADTIVKVLLYDPVEDRFLAATREELTFGHYLYNLGRDVLLLRLSIRVKEKSRYFLRQQTLADPASGELLAALHDAEASNVEIRKAKAANPATTVTWYYTRSIREDGDTLELPRDSLGRLWDRLEENPVTSALFHGLTRRFAHHVELFLTPDDFAAFWETHDRLPLAKIQLRYIKRDGFPHSPFQDHDCVSVDLFMLKKHRPAFEEYVRTTLPNVRFNPGKHSM